METASGSDQWGLTPTRSRPLDDDGRIVDRRIEHDIGLADAYADPLHRREALEDAVGDGDDEAFEQKAIRPREDFSYETGNPPIVHGVLDPVACGRNLADVDPEIDEKSLPEPSLLLEVTVMPEDDKAR